MEPGRLAHGARVSRAAQTDREGAVAVVGAEQLARGQLERADQCGLHFKPFSKLELNRALRQGDIYILFCSVSRSVRPSSNIKLSMSGLKRAQRAT